MNLQQSKLEKKLRREYKGLANEIEQLTHKYPYDHIESQIQQIFQRQLQIVKELEDCTGFCYIPIERIIGSKYGTSYDNDFDVDLKEWVNERMDRSTLGRMTEQQIDHWFSDVNYNLSEYELFCSIIIEDLANPDTPKIIKDYLIDLDNRLRQYQREYEKGK